MLRLIDTHAHLDEIENLDKQIAEAKEAGLVAIIAVGSDLSSNQKVLELSVIYKEVYPALG
jgi:Tat protein secretion system quality control protein TatD with DNase activity